MMPVALSMAQLHSSAQHDKNESFAALFGHVMPLALAWTSTHADGVINGITALPRPR